MNWKWVKGQLEGRDYWNESFPPTYRLKFRRDSWPIRPGEIREGWPVVFKPGIWIWRIWQEELDDWFAKKHPDWEKNWYCGWGGQIGADDPEQVMINGKILSDGGGWHPTKEDMEATDWERI